MDSSLICRTARGAVAVLSLVLLGCLAACSSGSVGASPSYTLSGTVSGLSASGLVLGNGGQPLAVASGSTRFSYGPILSPGASYGVVVQTQPAGEICSVSNGIGYAASANIANVVVACAAQAFSLGGTVSGLTTAGLVLANGDQTVMVDSGATTFAFSASVAKGSGYAVIVKTQPTGLACAVTHGTGTMPGSNVISVAVSCTDQPFNLGGSISGLTTAGLVLANGSDTITVSAHATSFTMPVKVAFGSHYALTVEAQPTGLTCTVSSGLGIMPAQPVTGISVACSDRSYLLGGSVSGLTASGLVLANGTDSLTVNANATSFTMPTAIAYGSSYAVTIQTQPTGLTCSVGGGAGTMPAGAISNVTISCALTTYTVGGGISGLAASGLVLANGSDTISVAANAAMFTMPMGVASGATYNVTVQTQPASQNCTVSNGGGTVGTSDITNVAVACVTILSYTTPGSYTWTVPQGVTSIQVVATGGGGGGSFGYSGGNGGVATVTLGVTAGAMFTLEVGGGGAYSGTGGGGGSSNVNAGTSDQIIAGGGGGAGGGAAGTQPAAMAAAAARAAAATAMRAIPARAAAAMAASAVWPDRDMRVAAGAMGMVAPGGCRRRLRPRGCRGHRRPEWTGAPVGTGCAGGGGGGGYGGGGGAGSGPDGDGGAAAAAAQGLQAPCSTWLRMAGA